MYKIDTVNTYSKGDTIALVNKLVSFEKEIVIKTDKGLRQLINHIKANEFTEANMQESFETIDRYVSHFSEELGELAQSKLLNESLDDNRLETADVILYSATIAAVTSIILETYLTDSTNSNVNISKITEGIGSNYTEVKHQNKLESDIASIIDQLVVMGTITATEIRQNMPYRKWHKEVKFNKSHVDILYLYNILNIALASTYKMIMVGNNIANNLTDAEIKYSLGFAINTKLARFKTDTPKNNDKE